MNHEIRPAKRVINQLRLSHTSQFPKFSSIGNVPKYLGRFKTRLLNKHDKIPKLYFVKFDVQACYDSIPISQVESVLNSLLKEEEVYYYCSRSEIDLSSLSTKQSRFLKTSTNLHELNPLHTKAHHKAHLLSAVKVSSLRGTDILKTTTSQLHYSSTKIGTRTYTRKDGVFQGLPQSSLFCDIVYDKPID